MAALGARENTRMPLLGNRGGPHPGKLVFTVLPYAWGAFITF